VGVGSSGQRDKFSRHPGNKEQLDFLAAAIRGETIDRSGKPEPRASICPYRGLLPFREEDAEFFLDVRLTPTNWSVWSGCIRWWEWSGRRGVGSHPSFARG